MIAAIVCADSNYGIGRKNDLLVKIPEDMKMFKETTTNGVVVMGKNTFKSLGNKPLPNRTNVVITSQITKKTKNKKNVIYTSIDVVKEWLSQEDVIKENENIFIIGGGQTYKELLPFCERIFITKINRTHDNADTFFPNIENMSEWELSQESEIKRFNGVEYQFCIYDRNDYSIESISYEVSSESTNFDITVKTFNGNKKINISIHDKYLDIDSDNWRYIDNEKNLLKFLKRVYDHIEVNKNG